MDTVRSTILQAIVVGTIFTADADGATAAPTTGARTDGMAQTPAWLDLGFTHRLRYETLSHQFRAGVDGGDQALLQYTSLRATAKLKTLRFGAELTDARAYLGDAGGALDSNAVNVLEPSEAWIGYAQDGWGRRVTGLDARFGRLTLNLGAGRLVGRNVYRNTFNSFTGADLQLTGSADDALRLVFLLPHQRRPTDQQDVLDNEFELDRESLDTRLFAATYQKTVATPVLGGDRSLLEAFAVRLDERDGEGPARQSANRRLTTLSARISRTPSPGALDFDVEGGVQFGQRRRSTAPLDQRDLDVVAGYVHGQLGYTFEHPMEPRITALYEYASGDDDPNDGRFGRFDGLYGPVAGDLGPTSLWTLLLRTNFSAPGARAKIAPLPRLTLQGSWHAIWLDSPRDAFSGTGIADASGRSGRFAGHQLTWLLRYALIPQRVDIDLGGAFLASGEFIERAPNADLGGNPSYFYGAVTLNF